MNPGTNRLTNHDREPDPERDLQARYYIAWDQNYLYLGAEGWDNVNDVEDPDSEENRWWFMDAVAWYMEAPRDDAPELFSQGDNAFCFVIDPTKPAYGAWWMHGAPGKAYIHEPIPDAAVDYQVRMNPWGRSPADFVLEARVDMAATFGQSDPRWTPPQVGDVYSLEIVHTDPDGGPYGGHLILYGNGDDDSTWGRVDSGWADQAIGTSARVVRVPSLRRRSIRLPRRRPSHQGRGRRATPLSPGCRGEGNESYTEDYRRSLARSENRTVQPAGCGRRQISASHRLQLPQILLAYHTSQRAFGCPIRRMTISLVELASASDHLAVEMFSYRKLFSLFYLAG